eukprot:CAMPEP_0119381234 /NCGR_PEP_ID=MMETSP1334-20130426/62227_1 /TAXON_ID=127549 /ORGANISM="Calcidiscus leptoporus, Strain RCC1130" /LENGTH=114 /DNA_ID=CAMNT_0007401295 /DNA_START=147 /DNA_END=487 /DNA_ORIENTATION=+
MHHGTTSQPPTVTSRASKEAQQHTPEQPPPALLPPLVRKYLWCEVLLGQQRVSLGAFIWTLLLLYVGDGVRKACVARARVHARVGRWWRGRGWIYNWYHNGRTVVRAAGGIYAR